MTIYTNMLLTPLIYSILCPIKLYKLEKHKNIVCIYSRDRASKIFRTYTVSGHTCN